MRFRSRHSVPTNRLIRVSLVFLRLLLKTLNILGLLLDPLLYMTQLILLLLQDQSWTETQSFIFNLYFCIIIFNL